MRGMSDAIASMNEDHFLTEVMLTGGVLPVFVETFGRGLVEDICMRLISTRRIDINGVSVIV